MLVNLLRFRIRCIISLAIICPSLLIAKPLIVVWYGTEQTFGQLGNPQRAVNILGNVSDPRGILRFTYSINGGPPVFLTQGPDTRRLLGTGDFNIDIPTASLKNGSNILFISATNNLRETASVTITVNYQRDNEWPTSCTVDWARAVMINDVAQVVDGHWKLEKESVRPRELGYDRLIAIGDTLWRDYEVTVPITIHGIDPIGGFGNPSNGPGVGMIFRWVGHTDNPPELAGMQPKTGFLPFGAIGWYNWDHHDRTLPPRLKLIGNGMSTLRESEVALEFGVEYYFMMRVETLRGAGAMYKLKVWRAGKTEPTKWALEGQQSPTDPQAGSVLLVAHHVDASFGMVVVRPCSTSLMRERK